MKISYNYHQAINDINQSHFNFTFHFFIAKDRSAINHIKIFHADTDLINISCILNHKCDRLVQLKDSKARIS